MVAVRKCQSKKHHVGGCGDPKCPEGLSLEAALQEAYRTENVNLYLKLKEMENPVVRHVWRELSTGYGVALIDSSNSEYGLEIPVMLQREGLREQVAAVDKTVFPDCETIEDLEEWCDNTYGKEVLWRLVEEDPFTDKETTVEAVSVSQVAVPADLRGLGVSSHLKKALCRFADQKGMILSGTPTNAGPGNYKRQTQNDPEWLSAAVKHRDRLEHSYQNHGYVRNPFWRSTEPNNLDYLTGQPHIYDTSKHDLFTEKAAQYLQKLGKWVRFPNQQVPNIMLKPRYRNKPERTPIK